jgi:hypothetical protein
MAQRLDETVVCGRIERNIPAAPGRKERRATLELRHTLVSLKRPWTLDKTVVAEIAVTAVDVREINAPPGVKPVHWLILTTHAVDGPEQAVRIIDIYRGRFLIEQLFRTLKTAGFNIESMELATPHAFITFTGFALLASAIILQLVKARDGRSGQLLEHAFEADDRPVLIALSRKLEGKTEKQKNPHTANDLAFASWVMARLGGWNCYYGMPGPETMRNGLERFKAIKFGTQVAKDV